MTTFGVAMCKDEADIIGSTIAHMLTQVDAIIVRDNGSTDGTLDILHSFGAAVEVVDDPEVAYYQSRKMTELAASAAARGAEWVIPFDADEWWYSPFGRIADVLADHPDSVAAAPIYDHVATAADPDEPDPVKRIGWRRRDPCPLHKVACRPVLPVTIEQGNHGATYPDRSTLEGQLVVRHFPNRSVDQLIRKVRNGAVAYAATDLPDHQGAHWRQWGQLLEEGGEGALGELFREWYWSADPEGDPDLIFDPAP